MRYDRQCVAAVQAPSGEIRRCEREASFGNPMYLTVIPICPWHEGKAHRQFAAPLQEELDALKQQVAEHECDGDRAIAQFTNDRVEANLRAVSRWREGSLTYFMRCGEYVKIGASASPLARLETIRTVGGILSPYGLDLTKTVLIATEPGGFNRERELHEKFKYLRREGEWFIEAPELTEYIESLKAQVAA